VEKVELLLPKNAPSWMVHIQQLIKEDRQLGTQALSEIAESVEKRIDARVWREFEFALHRELTDEQNIALAKEFVEDQICGRGIACQAPDIRSRESFVVLREKSSRTRSQIAL
jgi:ATP-dependent exoDNAse (exonuclease V) alpha subunit